MGRPGQGSLPHILLCVPVPFLAGGLVLWRGAGCSGESSSGLPLGGKQGLIFEGAVDPPHEGRLCTC